MGERCECGYYDWERPHSRPGGGACKYAYARRAGHIDDTGDIAIPDEVVDLRGLLDCRRERDEARAAVEQLHEQRADEIEQMIAERQRKMFCDYERIIDRLTDKRDEAREECERLREGKDLLAKELAYYRRDNEKLTNALAWELKESGNAEKEIERLRELLILLRKRMPPGAYSSEILTKWSAAIDAAREGE